MTKSSHPKAVVEALAEHEEAMSVLYNAFAQAYPEVGDLWKTLCAEEYAHGKLLRSLLGRVDEAGLQAFVAARSVDLDEVRAETKRLVDLAQLTAAAGLPLQEAFRTAVHLEDSLIESQVFVVSGGDSPEVAEVLGTLKEQTERHQKHLAESLSKFSGQ
jgi:hypothetical protein